MKISLMTLRYLQETLDSVRDNVQGYGEFHAGTIEVTIDGQRFKAKWDGNNEWDVEEVEKPKRARKVTAKTTMTPAAEETLRKSQEAGAVKKTTRKPMSPETKAAAAAKRAATIAAKKAQQS